MQITPYRFGTFRNLANALLVAALVLLGAVCGCSIEPTAEEAAPLLVERSEPGANSTDIPLNPPIRFYFNQYLDTAPLRYWNMVSVRSKGIYAGGRAYYDMVDRRIRFELYRPLDHHLKYTITLNDEVIRSVDGTALDPVEINVQTGGGLVEHPQRKPYPTYEQRMASLFEQGCSCHGEPQRQLPALTHESLLSTWSSQLPDRRLVQPFDAPNSYLMHKVLWDYPIREGQPMPPPWSGGEQLQRDKLRLIERWIRSGAR